MDPLDTCQITGKPDASGWSQIRLVNTNDSAKLIILASGRDSPNKEQIVTQINTTYHQLEDLTKLERIKKAVLNTAGKHPVEIAAIVFKGNYIWMAAAGKGQIKLYRAGQLVNLIDNQAKQTTAVSGLVRSGDRFVLATSRFFQKIPQSTLNACLEIDSLSQINCILAPIVHSKKRQGRLAVAIVAPTASPAPLPKKPFAFSLKQTAAKKRFKDGLEKLDSFVKRSPPPQQPLPAIPAGKTHVGTTKKFPLSLGRGKFAKIFKKRRIKVKTRPPDQPTSGQNKAMTLIAVVFLFLLGISLTISWQKKRQKDRQKALQVITTQAEEKLSAAWSIRELDLEKGLKLAKEAKEQSLEGLKINPNNETLKKILSQSEKIISLSGGQKLAPESFFDFKIIASNVSADQLYLNNSYLWIIDREGKRLIKLDIKSKKTQLVASGSEIAQQKNVLVSGKNIFFWSDEGIKKLIGDDSLKTLVKWDGKKPIVAALWGGNVYVVEQNQGILKYTGKDKTLSKPVSWLKKKVDIDWQKIVSMDIDGQIWLLDGQGKVYRFAQGMAESFSSPNINAQASFLTVAKATDKLAFWDSKEKTVFVLSKSGKLLAKIPLKLEKVNGIRLTDKGEKIFILAKDKVYFLNLQI